LTVEQRADFDGIQAKLAEAKRQINSLRVYVNNNKKKSNDIKKPNPKQPIRHGDREFIKGFPRSYKLDKNFRNYCKL